MKNERIHVIVLGNVQGVGFRYSACRKAKELGLVGWVRNLSDGSVEIFSEGLVENIEEFLTWCSHGPQGSTVTEVQCKLRKKISGKVLTSFEVRYN